MPRKSRKSSIDVDKVLTTFLSSHPLIKPSQGVTTQPIMKVKIHQQQQEQGEVPPHITIIITIVSLHQTLKIHSLHQMNLHQNKNFVMLQKT